MNQRERDALDRYITGNWGEDQFKGHEAEHAVEETNVAITCGARNSRGWSCTREPGHAGKHSASGVEWNDPAQVRRTR